MAPLAYPLVEERGAELVNFNGNQQPIKRKDLFLNPTSSTSSLPRPNVAGGGAASGDEPKYPHFRWWADPQPQWDKWVDKLSPKYAHIWKKVGIFDPIMASKFKIRKDPSSLLGVSRFWSERTNTFIFPWAEATVTLEDAMVLGGFSVLGEPVRLKEPVEGVTGPMVSKMTAEVKNFKLKCPGGEQLMNHYMGRGKGDEIEHIVFISTWLSRFVLITSNRKLIRECAVRLARGTRIALAPAVLASVYRELRVVKENLCKNLKSSISVWAPMNVVQLWLWERFMALRPGSRSLISSDAPRASRWSRTAGKALDFSSVMKVLESPDEFLWRPYVDELKHEGGWYSSGEAHDEDLQSFAKSLRACELVGLDCIEQYQPHRVAMQFGLDQDIPKFVPRVNHSWEVAWKTYDISLTNVNFCVPPRFCSGEVTIQYSNWWRNKKKKSKEGQGLSISQMKKVKRFHETVLSASPVVRRHKVSGECAINPRHAEMKLPLVSSERVDQNLDVTSEIELMREKIQKEVMERKDPTRNKESKHKVKCKREGTEAIGERDLARNTKLECESKCRREAVEESDAARKRHNKKESKDKTKEMKSKLERKDQASIKRLERKSILVTKEIETTEERAPTSNKELERESKGKTEDKTNMQERDPARKKALECESMHKEKEIEVIRERDSTRKKAVECEAIHGAKEIEAIEERDSTKKKELERDLKIKRLKEEIASIQANIKYWEFIAEAQSKLNKVSSPLQRFYRTTEITHYGGVVPG